MVFLFVGRAFFVVVSSGGDVMFGGGESNCGSSTGSDGSDATACTERLGGAENIGTSVEADVASGTRVSSIVIDLDADGGTDSTGSTATGCFTTGGSSTTTTSGALTTIAGTDGFGEKSG